MPHSTYSSQPFKSKEFDSSSSIRKNFSWIFCGNIFYAGCQWLLIVVLAKITTPEMVGEYAIALALTAPIYMFTGLNLRAIQATDSKNNYFFVDFFYARVFTSILALIITFTVILLYGSPSIYYSVIAISVLKFIESLNDICYGYFQKHEKMSLISLSMITRGISLIVLFFLFLKLSNSISISILAVSIIWFFILLFDIKKVNKLSKKVENWNYLLFRPEKFKTLILTCLPLGVVMMINSLNLNIPRYFIEKLYGLEELGIYAAIGYIMVVGLNVITALSQTFSPRIANIYNKKDMQFLKRNIFKVLFLGFSVGMLGLLVSMVFGETILQNIFGVKYSKHTTLLHWIMVGSTFCYLSAILGMIMTSMRVIVRQLPISILSSFAGVLAAACLIPKYGLNGAGACICIVFFTHLPIKSYLVWKEINICER